MEGTKYFAVLNCHFIEKSSAKMESNMEGDTGQIEY